MEIKMEIDTELIVAYGCLHISTIADKEYIENLKKYIEDNEKDNGVNDYLYRIGIYNEDYKLTEDGYQLKDHNEIYLKEYGLYKLIITAEHPFLDTRLISIDYEEKDTSENQLDNDITLKDILNEKYKNQEPILLCSNNEGFEKIKLEKIETISYDKKEKKNAKFVITIYPEEKKYQSKFEYKYKWSHTKDMLEDDFKYDDIIRRVDTSLWDDTTKKYKISKEAYGKLSYEEKKSMHSQEKINNIDNKYRYTFYDIDLTPNEDCKQEWFLFLLDSEIKTYINNEAIKSYVAGICNKDIAFECFRNYNIDKYRETKFRIFRDNSIDIYTSTQKKYNKDDKKFWYTSVYNDFN